MELQERLERLEGFRALELVGVGQFGGSAVTEEVVQLALGEQERGQLGQLALWLVPGPEPPGLLWPPGLLVLLELLAQPVRPVPALLALPALPAALVQPVVALPQLARRPPRKLALRCSKRD